jgi:hypothetical protein
VASGGWSLPRRREKNWRKETNLWPNVSIYRRRRERGGISVLPVGDSSPEWPDSSVHWVPCSGSLTGGPWSVLLKLVRVGTQAALFMGPAHYELIFYFSKLNLIYKLGKPPFRCFKTYQTLHTYRVLDKEQLFFWKKVKNRNRI